jgi:predicted transcriptional regulator
MHPSTDPDIRQDQQMSDKQPIMEAIRSLPDEATSERILEEVALLTALRRGLRDLNAGRVVPHEEVKRRVKQWLSK